MKTNLSSSEIREIFLSFFERKDHLRISAAPLVPVDDPTLLFINSGMAPMKKYFVGAEKPPQPDLCNVQPCLRTIDIEDVGDRHHLTLFEMLGSWSIGNYFKERAVELAFELLVEHFGFPADKLYVTVYGGDPALDLPPDEVTARAWENIGIARERIVYLGEDNFWGPAGEHGPCGPCTEVFFDTGPEYGDAYVPGGEFDTTSRYIEIWNAGVFMELDKKPDGSFERLPFTSVDTGSGLERMAMVLGGHPTAYETDLLRPLFDGVTTQIGERAPVEDRRVATDHLRAATFILGEGVRPGNEGRAYIPRRLIRKVVALAVRNDATSVDYERLIGGIVDQFGGAYPHLAERKDDILGALSREVRDFERVIGRGFERLDSLCGAPGFEISGKDAFDLFATYGVPIDLVRDFVRERKGRVDEESFEREFRRHQEVSRAGRAEEGPWSPASAFEGVGEETAFTGYTEMASEGQIVGLLQSGARTERAPVGDTVEVVADRTPFYPEGGGQVGDKGRIITASGEVRVDDTQLLAERYVHRGEVTRGEVRTGERAELRVDDSRRRQVMANHSATHLLHSALRHVLGQHANQAGSLVESDRLRFDFEHPKKLSLSEIHEIERLVNYHIQQNYPRETVVTDYDDAVKNRGAIAFFDESYGDTVRVVKFGPVSTELCGGTHVSATGDIGMFRITQESSVGSGLRRIVAVTGQAAVDHTLEEDRVLKEVASELKVSVSELPQRVAALKQKPKNDQKDKAASAGIDAKAAAKDAGGVAYVAERLDGASAEAIREEALRVADAIGGVAVLAGADDDKVRLVVAVAKPKTDTIKAPAVLKTLAPLVGGRGGGQPHLAQGGGTKPEAIGELLEGARSAVEAARS